MKMRWIFLPFSAVALAGSFFVSASIVTIDDGISLGSSQKPVQTEASFSISLDRAIKERINADSRIAMEAIADEDARKVVLENAYFSRGDGVVTGSGRFWDGRAPRVLRIFIDAYGDGPDIIESFPLDVRTTGKSQEFVARAPDKATFTRFAFRFTSNGEQVSLSSPSDDQLNIATVSSEAMLFPSDYGEVDDHLAKIGLLSEGGRESVTVLEDVRRFRRLKGMKGPEFVTIGDLYGLRIETGLRGGSMKILPYVLWASSIGGGRAVKRPAYAPSIKAPIPEDLPDAVDEATAIEESPSNATSQEEYTDA